jgi:hypothetical protein
VIAENGAASETKSQTFLSSLWDGCVLRAISQSAAADAGLISRVPSRLIFTSDNNGP